MPSPRSFGFRACSKASTARRNASVAAGTSRSSTSPSASASQAVPCSSGKASPVASIASRAYATAAAPSPIAAARRACSARSAAEVVRLRLRPEQSLGGIEVRPGLLRAAVLDQRPRAGDVRPGQVDGVLRRLEQRDRAAEVLERVLRPALVPREAAERPVDAHLRVRVDEGLHLGEDVVEDALGAVEVAEVGEREAEVGREADARREVGRGLLLDHGDAALEELRGVGGASRHRVRAAQRPEDVGSQRRRDVVLLHGPLERRDGVGGPARLERREADRDPGAARSDDVARLLCLGQQLAEPLVRRVGVLREAQVELGLRQPQLAELVLAHVRAGLQVLGGDAELPRQLAQRLHRRLPRSGLDPRDVGVRDPGGRELALGQAALGPEPPKACADSLLRCAAHRHDSPILRPSER